MAFGGDIEALDYNTIRGKIIEVLGTGSASFGYGQTIQSSPVFADQLITKNQWDYLRYDILNARVHQGGQESSIVAITENQIINDTANDPAVNYNAQATLARENRFNIASGRTLVTAIGLGNDPVDPIPGEYNYTSSWSRSLSIELTCTFDSSNEARYFFNSGGKIRITGSISGYSDTLQNNAWNSLLQEVGDQSFGAGTDTDVTYYGLTDQYQTYYTLTSSPSYADNFIKLEAKTDIENNTLGGAKILYIKVTLVDGYIDPDVSSPTNNPPDDVVDGDIKILFEEIKAIGDLQPSGTFTINSPLYSVGSFSADS